MILTHILYIRQPNLFGQYCEITTCKLIVLSFETDSRKAKHVQGMKFFCSNSIVHRCVKSYKLSETSCTYVYNIIKTKA